MHFNISTGGQNLYRTFLGAEHMVEIRNNRSAEPALSKYSKHSKITSWESAVDSGTNITCIRVCCVPWRLFRTIKFRTLQWSIIILNGKHTFGPLASSNLATSLANCWKLNHIVAYVSYTTITPPWLWWFWGNDPRMDRPFPTPNRSTCWVPNEAVSPASSSSSSSCSCSWHWNSEGFASSLS